MNKELLKEHVITVISKEEKQKYIDTVWNILQKSYAPIGGLKGNGLSSKEEMMDNTSLWKLIRKNGEIVAVSIYKDVNGRKRVASGTVKSPEGVKGFDLISKEDLEQGRAYSEVSGNVLRRLVQKISNIKKYAVPPSEVEQLIGKQLVFPLSEDNDYVKKYPELKDYFYSRKIGSEQVVKIMFKGIKE